MALKCVIGKDSLFDEKSKEESDNKLKEESTSDKKSKK